MKFILPLHLKDTEIKVSFQKLSNKEWYDLHSNYAPMSEDWEYLMYLDFHHYKKTDFHLAKMYLSLFTLFGGHNNYDDYKCSFAYRFKLLVERDGKKYDYALSIMDMKGNMPYFTYYRKTQDDEDANAYQDPIFEQFSKSDMRKCTTSFIIFLENFFLAYRTFFYTPFYRVNQAGYLIYGFQDGAFFNDFYSYSEEEDYDNFRKKIAEYEALEIMKTPMSKDFWKDEEVEKRTLLFKSDQLIN